MPYFLRYFMIKLESMEKIYSDSTNSCKLISARRETIQLLLGYSSSLNIIRHDNKMTFENNLN